jgi:hypothetical protein
MEENQASRGGSPVTYWLIDRHDSTAHVRFGDATLELRHTIELIDTLEATFADQSIARVLVDGDPIRGDKRAIRATLVALATHAGVWGKEFEFRADIVQLPDIDEVPARAK